MTLIQEDMRGQKRLRFDIPGVAMATICRVGHAVNEEHHGALLAACVASRAYQEKAMPSPVMIALYSDVHCPYAYITVYRLRQLREEYHDRLTIAFKSLALEYVN